MLYLQLTNELLEEAAKDAEKRKQFGLIIWATETHWRRLADKLTYDNPMYKAMAENLQNGILMWLSPNEIAGRVNPNIEQIGQSSERKRAGSIRSLAVPTSKMVGNDEEARSFQNWVYGMCETGGLYGPITMVPSMRLNPIYIKY